MKAPQTILTTRLLLRPPAHGDTEAIFERYASDPDVTRYVSFPRHRNLAATRTFIDWSRAEWERWPAGPYLIFARHEELLLGGTGLKFETSKRAEVGYLLARDSCGRGFATEALAAMVELAADLGVDRLQASCHTAHRPSQRVLEKCGFEVESRLRHHMEFPNLTRGVRSDVLLYVITPGRARP